MSSPLNLLLVCYHDPDSNLIGAVRVRKFAENLTASGCSVKVLSRAGVTSYAHGLQSTEAVAGPDSSRSAASRQCGVGAEHHHSFDRH